MKKILSILLQFILIFQIFAIGFLVRIEKAYSADTTVHLNTDGSNSDCGTNLTDQTGGTGTTTYILDNDMTCAAGNGLNIAAENIIVDGNYHNLIGNNKTAGTRGILSWAHSNFTVQNFGDDNHDGITQFEAGILTSGSVNSEEVPAQILNNSLNNNKWGIYIYGGSSYFDIEDNIANSNSSAGFRIEDSTYHTISGNTANSNTTWGFLLAANANHNTMTGNTASLNPTGITFSNSTDNTSKNMILNGNSTAIGLNTNATVTLDNATVNNANIAVGLVSSGDVLTLKNCIFTNNNIVFNLGTSGGTINSDHSVIQGRRNTPLVYTTGTAGTWNGSAIDGAWHGDATDINDPFTYYTQTKEDTGFFAFSTDDDSNIDYFKEAADYAMENYGIAMTIFVNNTDNLTADEITKLQALHNQGDEIGVHTRDHTNLSYTYPFTVTYSGAGTGMTLNVNADATQLWVTGTADTFSIDLTASPDDVIGSATQEGVCHTIDAMANYACSAQTSTSSVHSNALKTQATALSGATPILYDDDSSANNRFLTEEITNSINDLTTILGEAPTSFAFPYTASSAFVRDWIRNNTSLTSARGSSSHSHDLTSVDLYDVSYRYFDTDIDTDIPAAAAVMASYTSMGQYMAMLNHNESDGLSLVQLKQLIDELSQYRDYIEINTYGYFANKIKTSGDWADAGGGVWTRTFIGSDNFQPISISSVIDAGTEIAGVTTDFAGNPIYGTPDIGAYEYQPPYTMSTNEIDIAGGAVVYGDGQFRDKEENSGLTADLSVAPESGSFPNYGAAEIRPQWMEITINTWNTGGDYSKEWIENGVNDVPTAHIIGDLVANTYYTVTNNAGWTNTYRSDANGQISFTYDGGYSAHTFNLSPKNYSSGSGEIIFQNLPDLDALINLEDGQMISEDNFIIKVKPYSKAGIQKVEFYVDDNLLCVVTEPDENGVYSCEWDTTQYHSIVKIIAYDNNDNTQTITRTVTVAGATTDATQPTELPQTGADIKR